MTTKKASTKTAAATKKSSKKAAPKASAKKASAKKATPKKAATKKAVKKSSTTASKNGTVKKPAKPTETKVTANQIKVLRAIARRKQANYRDIEKATGLYAPLTAMCKAESNRGKPHPTSLEARGLIKQVLTDDSVVTFAVTDTGRKFLKTQSK